MTRKTLFSLLTTLFCSVVLAQQESQYTQYMYNTMLFNPGYTGSREVGSFFGMFRTQWVGIKGAPTNGTTVVNPDGTIEYRPHTGFEGIDTFVYELCNTDGCASATVTIEVISKLIPYNGMSVDDDGKNEHFHIGGINRYPDNVVRIYNRWGVKVFETEGYDNVTKVFKGISDGRVTVEASDRLPQGTYYYIIEYVDDHNKTQTEVGWLYLKKN